MNPEQLLPPSHFTDSPQESSAAPQGAAAGGGATASAGNTAPRHASPSGFTANIYSHNSTFYQIQGNAPHTIVGVQQPLSSQPFSSPMGETAEQGEHEMWPFLKKVVKQIGRDYWSLAIELGISQGDVELMERNHARDLERVIWNLMLKFQHKCQRDEQKGKATVLKALREIERNDIVHDIGKMK